MANLPIYFEHFTLSFDDGRITVLITVSVMLKRLVP